MSHSRTAGACILLFVLLGGAFLSWSYLHFPQLSHSEIDGVRPGPKPPSEPPPSEPDYSDARHKPCIKSEQPIATNICSVLKTPTSFSDKCISVRGRFLSDGLEHSVIVDDSCRGFGLVPWGTDEVTEQLDMVIWRPGKKPGTSDRRVTAQFTGRFVWRPKARRDVRVLEINAVKDLKVEKVSAR